MSALTQREQTRTDLAVAEMIAARLGYRQTVYTSTSAVIGLFCLKENPHPDGGGPPAGPVTGGCVVKTDEMGWLFVQDLEDLNLHDLAEKEATRARRAERRERKAQKEQEQKP
jgi:hypothetical protein